MDRSHSRRLGKFFIDAWRAAAPADAFIYRDIGLNPPPPMSQDWIAAAFTATIYGIGLANLFFLPVAAKLKVIIARQTQFREMVVDGMLCIAQGENPRAIESKLQGYLH